MKILLIEDDVGITKLMVKRLNVYGYQTESVNTAREALDYLKSHTPDLLILDYSLPDMNGCDFIASLRNIKTALPVFIVATGQGDERVAVNMMKLGARDYVVKDGLFLDLLPEAVRRVDQEILNQRKIDESEAELQHRKFLLDESQALAHIGSWELDLTTNRLTWSDEVYRIFGLQPQQFAATYDAFLDSVYPEDRELVEHAYTNSLRDGHDSYEVEHRIQRKDTGEIRYVHERCQHSRNQQGQVIRSVGMVQDITTRKQNENQLKQALQEKTILLQELYHRTKNNMQVIYSMLALHASYRPDPQIQAVLKDVQGKIHSMALVHEKLYQSHNLSSIDLRDYLRDLAKHLQKSYQISAETVLLDYQLESACVLIDIAIPCGLVFAELLSNAFKYAFPPPRKGRIHIQLQRSDSGLICLQVSDNGVGLPPDFNVHDKKTLGIQTIYGLVEHQLHGQIFVETEGGVHWEIQFKDNLYGFRI